MLIEVSSTPKPGNIDRNHDYIDTSYEHFLASAVGVYPVLEEASREKKIGNLIKKAVIESMKWQNGGNTHFGAFILLIPLIIAAQKSFDIDELRANVSEIVKNTDIEDAIEFYIAFSKSNIRVKQVKDLSLKNKNSIDEIRKRKLTLYNLMEISSSYDMIANEWTNNFEKSFECSYLIKQNIKKHNLNDTVVFTFMELLSKYNDTFIQTKFNLEKAKEVSERAKKVFQQRDMKKIREFDRELLNEGVNPGSIADIIIAGLFISFFEGMKI